MEQIGKTHHLSHLDVDNPNVGDMARDHDLASELVIEHPLGLLQIHAGGPAHTDLKDDCTSQTQFILVTIKCSFCGSSKQGEMS